MSDDQKLLTMQESCKYLGVSRPTFNKIRKEAGLTEYPIGKRVRFSQSELDLKVLSASKNIKDNAQELKKLKLITLKVDTEGQTLTSDYVKEGVLDIDEFDQIDSYGAICLMIFILKYIESYPLKLVSGMSSYKRRFLLHSGIYDHLNKFSNENLTLSPELFEASEVPIPEIYLPILQVGFKGAQGKYTEHLKKILKTQGFSEDIGHYIGWALGELADNSHTHANASGKCFISSERFTGNTHDFLQINILDMGDGIHKTLKENPKYRDLSDEKAIVTSFKSFVSSWADEHKRGKGLTDIIKIALECNSFFRVECGDICFEIYCKSNKGLITKIDPMLKVNGTRFSITFIDNEFRDASRKDVDDFVDKELKRLCL